MEQRFYLIRHGQASIFSSNYDQLSALGYKQAEACGESLSELPSGIAIFSGPLARQLQSTRSAIQSMKANNFEILDGLAEHEGYSILKEILPKIVLEDEDLRAILNEGWKDRKEQIQHHMRVYDYFSKQWIAGKYSLMVSEKYESFLQFKDRVWNAFLVIKNKKKKENVIVSSAGTISVIYGKALGLTDLEINKTSQEILNASKTIIDWDGECYVDTLYNDVSFLEKQMITLV